MKRPYMTTHELRGIVPKVLPHPWQFVASTLPCWVKPDLVGDDRLAVIATYEHHDDGRWLHISTSRIVRLPSWEELREVKDLFIGKDKLAIQVLPPERDYVNEHRYCLHLWHSVDYDPVPGFARREPL